MAAPNLLSPTTINGKTTYVALTATTETTLLTNASASGKALRVNHVTVANVSATTTSSVTVKIYTAASGGTGYALAATMTVPVGASIIVVGRENPVYLEEDRRITVTAGTANILEVVCSYEDIS